MIKPACAALAVMLTVVAVTAVSVAARADDAQVKRGEYLVTVIGCGDCHTPGTFLGKPDMTKLLGGSDVAFEVPGLGAFAGSNLTPDKTTGIGDWTPEQIVMAFQHGKAPDGHELAPSMPWRDFATLSEEDAMAIAAYLKSIPPVVHKVAGPFKPGEKVTSFLFRIMPPGAIAARAAK
jgi:mono/diheme cytochrome c family protein